MIKMNKALLNGSLILLITFNIFNILNFIYSLLMVRFLSLGDYGILASLIYIALTFAVFSESIQIIISKYVTKEESSGKVKNIIKKSIRKGIYVSSVFFIFYLIIAIFLSKYLKINYSLLAVIGLSIFLSFLIPVTRGALQGKKRFKSLGLNMIAEGAIKLISSILLVLIGFKVYGAVLGIILGSLFAFAISFISLKDILSKKEQESQTPNIYNYTRPVFITNLTIILILSLDIIIAKIFFSPESVGAYAIASTIAKILFIGTQPISRAMFPISTESKTKSNSKRILFNSIL